MRHETQVHADDVDVQLAGEIGDRLQLGRAGGARFMRHEADGSLHGRDIGVAFAFEAGEDAGDRDAEIGQLLVELGRPLRRARGGVRRVQMNRANAQVAGDLQPHAQPGVDARKYANWPFFHGELSSGTRFYDGVAGVEPTASPQHAGKARRPTTSHPSQRSRGP